MRQTADRLNRHFTDRRRPHRGAMLRAVAAGLAALGGIAHAAQDQPPPGPPPGPAPTAILEIIPADSWVVVTWRDMQGFERKLATLQGQIDFSLPISPGMGLKAYLSILEGLHEDGDAALVLRPPVAGAAEEDWGGRSIIVLPVKDYAASIQGLAPASTDGSVTRVTVRNMPSFAARKGNFLLIAEAEPVLRAFLDGGEPLARRWSAHQLERFTKNDLSCWVHLAKVFESPALQEAIKDSGPFAALAVRLRECREAQWSLRLAEEGLHAEFLWTRTAPSQTPPVSRSAAQLLMGLPAEGYALAVGVAFADSAELAAVPAALLEMGTSGGVLDPARAQALTQIYTDLVRHVRSVRVSAAVPQPGPDGMVALTKIIETDGQPEEILRGVEAWVAEVRKGPFRGTDLNAMLAGVEFKREAESVGDIKVHHLTADWSSVEHLDLPVVRRIFGKDAPLLRFGIVGDKTVLITCGGGSTHFQSVAELIKAGRSPLADLEATKKVASAQPLEGFARALFDPAQCGQLARSVSRELDGTAEFPLPDVHTPLSVVVRGVGQGSKECNLLIPVDVIRAAKDMMLGAPSSQPAPPGGR